VDDALAREADRQGSSAANALRQFARSYVQERSGRIRIFAEPPRIYADPEDAEEDAIRRCPNFFGNDIADDAAFWRATYDPRTDRFIELDLNYVDAHL
jgi:hypothetical protein